MSFNELLHYPQWEKIIDNIIWQRIWLMMVVGQIFNIVIEYFRVKVKCYGFVIAIFYLKDYFFKLHLVSIDSCIFKLLLIIQSDITVCMDYIRRIGTQRHKYKLQFVMRKLNFTKKIDGKIYISVVRGDHKAKTQQEYQMKSEKECDLKKEILTFPSITLFYDAQNKHYLEKLGEMKIVLIKDQNKKKMLGLVPFDVAQFANSKIHSNFIPNQTQQKLTINKKIEEIPEKMRMEGEISFNVYIKYMGQASETQKSLNKQKVVRSQSPFDRFKNFIFGNDDEKGTQTQKSSPKKEKKEDINTPTNEKNSKINRKSIQKQEEKGEQKKHRKHRNSLDTKNEGQQSKISRKKYEQKIIIKDIQKEAPSLQEQRNNKYNTLEKKKNSRRSAQQQQKQLKIQKSKSKDESKVSEFKMSNNIIQSQQIKQNSTEGLKATPTTTKKALKHQSSLKNPPKVKHQKVKQTQKIQVSKEQDPNNLLPDVVIKKKDEALFYFDDPSSYPNYLKKDKKQIQPNEQQTKLKQKSTKIINQEVKKRTSKKQTSIKVRKVVSSNSDQDKSQSIEQKIQTKIIEASPPVRKKVKENTIAIDKTTAEKSYKQKSKQQPGKPTPNQTNKPIVEQNLPLAPIVQQNSNSNLFGKSSSNLLSQFDQKDQKKNQALKTSESKKKQKKQAQPSIFLHQQLEKKGKQFDELTKKVEELQLLRKKIKDEEKLRQSAEKISTALKEQNQRLEKEVERLKTENTNLRSENSNQSSIFRQTYDHYQQEDVDQDLLEQNKKLQKQKNQLIVTLTKQKEKHKKQIKEIKQQIEKTKGKFLDLQNSSKVELKKLKDQIMKINSSLEASKQKNKQKTKQNELLLAENKTLNTQIISLNEKICNIKKKICEKLNEANENQQSQIMQTLTELNQVM